MADITRKEHWEKIYETRNTNEVSWYQAVPKTSLDLIREMKLPLNASIIDIGGGDSMLADYLLDLGYTNITVLDISANAIKKAKERLGKRANKIKWIISDVTLFKTDEKYDLWHDRATFHFLTRDSDINGYVEIARKHIRHNGFMIVGTFSDNGPENCSGLRIKQYSASSLVKRMSTCFRKLKCTYVDHFTPAGAAQNFIFCVFRRIV